MQWRSRSSSTVGISVELCALEKSLPILGVVEALVDLAAFEANLDDPAIARAVFGTDRHDLHRTLGRDVVTSQTIWHGEF